MSKSMTDEETVESLQNQLIQFKSKVNIILVTFQNKFSQKSLLKTNRYLRLRELIAEHSKNANLVVM